MVNLGKRVTIRELIKLAIELKSGDDENLEYARGMVELITDAARLSMDHKDEIARLVGIDPERVR